MKHCIIYYSSSEELLREADLLSLLEQSRRDNAEKNITGILLFVQGSILQVLEGEENVIEALYKKIEQDPRHTHVTKVFNRHIQQRSFQTWNMGYKTISRHQFEIIKTIIDLEDYEWLTAKPSDNMILNILKIFYEDSTYN